MGPDFRPIGHRAAMRPSPRSVWSACVHLNIFASCQVSVGDTKKTVTSASMSNVS